MPIETLQSLARAAGHELVPSFGATFSTPGEAHLGASTTAKEMARWNPSNGSADADLLPDLENLRNRSRDIARNNGVASGAIQTTVDNVVGTGPRLAATPDYRALGRDKRWAEEWATIVEARWRAYTETTECDAAGQLTFAALTNQVFRGGLVNGEALSLPLWLPNAGKFATRHQVIEADRLCNPDNLPDDDKLRGGVEIDPYGRPLAYWVRTTHPGDYFGLHFGISGKWQRIPATTDWGRKRVVHVHDKERTGQTRGKPLLAPVLAQFRMLDTYHRTEMQAAVINAFVAAFMETNLPPEAVAEMLGADPNDDKFQDYVNSQREFVAPLRGAAIIPTMPGTKITPFSPGRPSEAFAPFTEAIERHIGVGIGLPFESLMKNFSKTNYSSARASLLEAYRFFLGRRRWLTDFWVNPVYHLWLEEQVNAGVVEAPGYYENQYAYGRCKWIWPGRGWIDPVKEIQAAEKRMACNISTLERECAEQGEDWEEVLEQRAREKARMNELGLSAPPPAAASARVPAAPPAGPVEDSEDEEEDDASV